MRPRRSTTRLLKSTVPDLVPSFLISCRLQCEHRCVGTARDFSPAWNTPQLAASESESAVSATIWFCARPAPVTHSRGEMERERHAHDPVSHTFSSADATVGNSRRAPPCGAGQGLGEHTRRARRRVPVCPKARDCNTFFNVYSCSVNLLCGCSPLCSLTSDVELTPEEFFP
jgi:hypothetical protein